MGNMVWDMSGALTGVVFLLNRQQVSPSGQTITHSSSDCLSPKQALVEHCNTDGRLKVASYSLGTYWRKYSVPYGFLSQRRPDGRRVDGPVRLQIVECLSKSFNCNCQSSVRRKKHMKIEFQAHMSLVTSWTTIWASWPPSHSFQGVCFVQKGLHGGVGAGEGITA